MPIHTEVVEYPNEKKYLKDARKRAKRRGGGWEVISVSHEKRKDKGCGCLLLGPLAPLLGIAPEYLVVVVTYQREGK